MKLIALASLCLSSAAAAQHPLIRAVSAGDATAIGAVTTIENLTLCDDGEWFVECDTNHANTAADAALLSRAGIVMREGDPMSAPAGATLSSFDGLSAVTSNRRAQNVFLDNTTGGSDDSGVYWNGNLTIQEGTLSQAPQLSAGTPYIGFFEVKSNLSDQIVIMASVDDPAIATSVDRALVLATVDSNGVLLSESVVAKEGDVLPGQTEMVADFGTGPHNFAVNSAGDVIYVVDLAGPTTADGAVYLNQTLIAQEGQPSPIPGRNWLTLSSSSTRVAINDLGAWVITGTLDGSTASDLVIVSNLGVIAQEGDMTPQGPLSGFGTGPVHVGNGNDVYHYAEWSSNAGAAWFRNQTPIIQRGLHFVAGQLITGLASGQDNSSLAPSGLGLMVEATVASFGNTAVIYDGTPGSSNYCTSKLTSVGCLPLIGYGGNPSASKTSGFDVFCIDTINNKVGLILYGTTGAANLPFQGGTLCVAAPLRRSVGVNSNGNPPPNDCSGVFSIDMNQFAHGLLGGNPSPALKITGTTLHMQWWGRDPGFAAPDNSTLSNGLTSIVGF